MAKDPERRIATMVELAEAVREALAELEGVPSSLLRRVAIAPRYLARRRRWPARSRQRTCGRRCRRRHRTRVDAARPAAGPRNADLRAAKRAAAPHGRPTGRSSCR